MIDHIRPATTDDLDSIAALHSASWHTAYHSMLPERFLDGVEERHRRQWASLPTGGFVLVAERDGDLAGFAAVLPGEAGLGDHLLDNLHTRPDLRGSGVGARLLEDVLARAGDRTPGGTLYLWVFEDNVGARRFYTREGGTEGETRIEAFDADTLVTERRMWWRLTHRSGSAGPPRGPRACGS